METVLREAATKSGLIRLLGDESPPPALLFTASHGVGFPCGDSLQRDVQGALLCQDWPGPSGKRTPIQPSTISPLPTWGARRVPRARWSFHFACYSAGTPRWDDFAGLAFGERRAKAPYPFVARLPQRLLERGALAVIGHIERAWDWSFHWLTPEPQLAVFESALVRLLDGHPIGTALEYFDQRYAELATELNEALQKISSPRGCGPAAPESSSRDDRDLTRLWTACRDARNYIVLGDPAVRLAVAPQANVTRGAQSMRSSRRRSDFM